MRLDKSKFTKQSFVQASNHQAIYNKMDEKTKSETFKYLMSVAYGFVGKDYPKMDKTIFSMRKHSVK